MKTSEIMSGKTVRNKHRDAVDGIREAYEKIPKHWLKLVPEFETVFTDMPIVDVPELQEQYKGRKRRMKPEDWPEVCLLLNEEGTDQIFVSSDGFTSAASGYQIKLKYMAEIARLMTTNSSALCFAVNKCSTGTAVERQNRDRGTLSAFRQLFAEFTLNPLWMGKYRKEEYDFMVRIDALVKTGAIDKNAA